MCDDCEWVDQLDAIDDLLEDERYEFAQDTLEGIREWVEENEHITDGQKKAINNIASAGDR